MGPPPVVTGISPKEGPPGTKVTVRGEFLGNGPNDLVGLTICGFDCLLSAEWKSSNKIIARSGPCKGRGDIVVTTRSGGKGTSTVQFRGYHETIGPLKESAVWVEEAPLHSLSWARRSLSPTSYQQEDPLGLSVEGNEKKFPEDVINELFPNGSSDITSETFDPARFLLENHHATSFEDLKAGLGYLKRKVDGQKEGQLSFLKANVGAVMDQLDTLIILQERFETDTETYGNAPTANVEKSIDECLSEAKKLYEEVLSRRERADATRNALGVLQRYKFLFGLPSSIERNSKRGDYDLIINDLVRAKSLFGQSESQVFKKVLAEVEQRITQLRELLWAKLHDMPTTLDDQKKLIRNLVNLEVTGDPAWEAITCHSTYLTQQLHTCRDEHLSSEGAVNISSMANSPGSTTESPPARVIFIEELADTLSDIFPDLWKLGQAYFCGDLNLRAESNRQSEFKRLVLMTMELFAGLVRAAVLPHTLDRMSAGRVSLGQWPIRGPAIMGPWLPQCLRNIRILYSTLIQLDLPGEALDIVSQTILDMRLYSMATIFQQATDQVKHLNKKETWKFEYDDKYGGLTELPRELERIVIEAVRSARDSVLSDGEIRETKVLETDAAKRQLSGLVQGLLLAFVHGLDSLAFDSNSDCESPGAYSVSQLGSPYVALDRAIDSLPNREERLLTVYSNSLYTSQVILPRIVNTFTQHGFPAPTQPISAAVSALNSLQKRILEDYLEQKSDPLVGTIEPSMYLGRFDWDMRRKPSNIGPYAKEIIGNLIRVFAEVHRLAPGICNQVLEQIVETVAEELSRLMSCVDRFSKEGSQQALADLVALRLAFKHYTTIRAEGYISEAIEAIPPLENPGDKLPVDDIVNRFAEMQRVQLFALTKSSTRNATLVRNPI